MKKNVKLGVIGCGKMASAILEGVYKNNFINPSDVFLYDINSKSSENLVNKFGFNSLNSIQEIVNVSDIIFLAVKPFKADEVLNEVKPFYNNQLIVSIMAGVKIEKYLKIIENSKIIRIMPNTPALVTQGMSAICSSKNVSSDEEEFVFSFMQNCGSVIKTSEDKMDIVTALSGSGPAFYFRIIDLMAKSAQKLGLDYKDAILLSSQTALGSAKMLMENNFDVEQLIKNVTTPGGCTEVGNLIIDNSNIAELFDEVISKTAKKATDLGK